MKNQNTIKKSTQKLLFVALILLLLPCFAFGSSPLIAASKVKANQPGTKLKKQIVPKNISKKMALKAAMKIRSIKFKTNASGDWTFLYDYENTGFATFAPHQLQYKSTQILTNGSRVSIHTVTYNRKNAPGTKGSAHSPWDRCSNASKLMLEIIHQGKVLDKKTVNVPPVNVKINNLSSTNGKFKALLKNNTGYTSKVAVRVASKSSLKGGSGSMNRVGVIVPANSTKTCTGTIADKGKTTNLEVLFRDEKKCSGKGYVVLDRKALPAVAGSGLSKADKVKALAGKVKVAGNLRSGATPPPQPLPPGPNPTPSDLPNLIITNVNVTLLGNSQFSISYKVRNSGGLCERGFNARFSKIGGSGDVVYVPPLAPNGIYDGTFTFSSQQLTTEIKVTADCNNVLEESNEQDNQWTGIARNPVSSAAALGGQVLIESAPVAPIANADLPPYDLSLKAVFLTQDNRLKIRISNPGPDISRYMFKRLAIGVWIKNNTMNYSVPEKRIAMTEVDPTGTLRTAGNSAVWYTFTWPVASNAYSNGIPLFNPGQSYRVTVFLGLIPSSGTGLNAEAPDSHPTNNIMTIRYEPEPDLVVCFTKQIHHNHTSRSYTYRPVVKNIGKSISGPSILRFYIQGKGGKNYSIPSLKVNEEYSIKRKIYWVTKGSRNFKLTVDKNDDNNESGGGELNNILKGKIDVVVYTPTVEPYTSPGQPVCSDAPGANN